MRPHIRPTAAQYREWAAMGLTQQQMAEKQGLRNRCTVAADMRALGVKMPGPFCPDEDLLRWMADTITRPQIAAEFGMSVSAINRTLAKFGIATHTVKPRIEIRKVGEYVGQRYPRTTLASDPFRLAAVR